MSELKEDLMYIYLVGSSFRRHRSSEETRSHSRKLVVIGYGAVTRLAFPYISSYLYRYEEAHFFARLVQRM